mmetsp:Transcript_28204/g.62458  ORF Transcript_28204/g.62458 Transcript_28204/m.62458 type:complete len:238 (+) Transcript_28204:262-975(+)
MLTSPICLLPDSSFPLFLSSSFTRIFSTEAAFRITNTKSSSNSGFSMFFCERVFMLCVPTWKLTAGFQCPMPALTLRSFMLLITSTAICRREGSCPPSSLLSRARSPDMRVSLEVISAIGTSNSTSSSASSWLEGWFRPLKMLPGGSGSSPPWPPYLAAPTGTYTHVSTMLPASTSFKVSVFCLRWSMQRETASSAVPRLLSDPAELKSNTWNCTTWLPLSYTTTSNVSSHSGLSVL